MAVECALVSPMVFANVRLPQIIGDGMVLQRDSPVRIWGWASPGEKVRIEFLNAAYTTHAGNDGRWSATIGPLSAGGPFTMNVVGRNQISLHNILVGDVWLASGQSNMEMPVGQDKGFDGVEDAPAELSSAVDGQMRLFTVRRASTSTPQESMESSGWGEVTPANASRFSAVAYFFGRELRQHYRIPIGVVESDWGGTLAESWMSRSALTRFPQISEKADHVNEQVRSYYETLLPLKRSWYSQHGTEDRGSAVGHEPWVSPDLDTHEWPTISIPRPRDSVVSDFNGFGGVVWLRKEVDIPNDIAGCDLIVQLGELRRADTTFWNGAQAEQTIGTYGLRSYYVPAKRVHAGKNVITVRLEGTYPEDYGAGMFGPAEQMKVSACAREIPLAGQWLYQPGPDMQTFPAATPELLRHIKTLSPPPTFLFNAMIYPLRNYRIKGVIWYQGEANALDGDATQYQTLFPALIADWRTHWGYDFPFLFVQLAGLDLEDGEASTPKSLAWIELRDAQSKTLSLPLTGMATAIDVGEANVIHPKNKQAVGHRLALVAERVAYGENVVDSGPIYHSMKIEDHKIRIEYTDVGTGLSIHDKYGYVRGFEIAGPDGRFLSAQAKLEGNDVVVFNDLIEHPVAVRYDWRGFPDGNIFNQEGLPALPFCTNTAPGVLSTVSASAK